MRIRKVKWKDHPILGSLELDFINPKTQKTYSTIVLVGENGTGKTTILETINTFLCMGSFTPFEYLEYEVEEKLYRAIPLDKSENDTYFKRIELSTRKITEIRNSKNLDLKKIQRDIEDPRHYGSLLSKPRSDYKTSKITSSTSQELDNSKYEQDVNDDFTSLKQLLIDIQSEDNDRYREINVERKEKKISAMEVDEFDSISKMSRFKNAFNRFFEELKYNKIAKSNGERQIVFLKHGKEIFIDNLSTGEKQIVFRGAFLLKNLNQLSGSIIMVDEPELSMHPKWQKKILDYYKNLFSDKKGNQTVQLFFASHSEYVVASAIKNADDMIVIILKEDSGVISAQRMSNPLMLPSVVASEVNYEAFGIPSVDYHIALYGTIQAKYNKQKLNDCDSFIENSSCYDSQLHEAITTNPKNGKKYKTLPTKVRNCIHHPDTTSGYKEEEMEKSIQLMREILKNIP